MENNSWKRKYPSFIDRIEVKGLLGQDDIIWNLGDVNILVGNNGTGKSTISKLINICLSGIDENTSRYDTECIENKFSSIDVYLNKGGHSKFEVVDFVPSELDIVKMLNDTLKMNISDEERNNIEAVLKFMKEKTPEIDFSKSFAQQSDTEFKELIRGVGVAYISTFDMILLSNKDVEKSNKVKPLSELDLLITKEQEILRKNLLSISNDVIDKFSDNDGRNNIKVISNNMKSKVNIFKKEVNSFFRDSRKSFEMDEVGDFSIKSYGEEISQIDISSGEKQLLYTLLKSLNVTFKRPAIIIMDEPEISLHIKWQKGLINSIKKIAEDSQIIIVTHSPGMIIDSWLSKVTELESLKV